MTIDDASLTEGALPRAAAQWDVDDGYAEFYPPGVPRRLDYDSRSIPELVAATVKRVPHRPAYVFRGTTLTFRELDALTERFARGLRALGVREGDRVLVCLPNIPQSPIAMLAVWRLGATCVLSNPLNTSREIAFHLSDSGATLAITLDVLLPRVTEASATVGHPVHVVATHLSEFMGLGERLLFPFVKPKMYRRIVPGPRLSSFRRLLFPAWRSGRSCDLRIDSYSGKNGSWVNPRRSFLSVFPGNWQTRFASVWVPKVCPVSLPGP